jgi:ferric-dicitrate binding protein FerR (iron transport regulator)
MSYRPKPGNSDWDLLAKYFSGNTSEAESKKIEQWAQSSPKNQELFRSAEEAWEASRSSRQLWDTDAAWNTLQQKIDERSVSKAQIKLHSYKPARKRNRLVPLLKVAAILFVVASSVTAYYQYFANTSVLEVVELAPEKVFTNKKGQRSTLQLPDNSKVHLAADSRLVLKSGFNDTERRVFIEGEAFFEITHNASKPFKVESDHGLVTVLGTKFNVNAYPELTQQEVAVAEGKVSFNAIEGNSTPAILTAGTLGILPFNGDDISIQRIENIEWYTGWINGQLIFNDTPLTSVITKLERWYDIKCEIKGESIGSKRLTGTFENQRLSEVLDAISMSLNLKHGKVEGTYVFSQS